jgi:hypothetical protein
MPYSDSSHFSDKFSYKILLISSYQSKDTNFARLEQILPFFRKQKNGRSFLTEGTQPGSLTCGADAMTRRVDWAGAAAVAPARTDGRGPPVRWTR